MSDELVKRHVEQLRMTGGMYEHPGYRKPYPIQTVLRDLASQEGCDGEPYDAMVFAASYIDCIIAHIAALTAQVAEAREQRADAEARMETAEVERDRLREAVRGLERASTEVASCGARTVPHWLKLTVANLSAREALKGERAMSDLIRREDALALRDKLADIIGALPMSSIYSALSEYRNAIRALPAVQPAHVNETPKREHDDANMLTPATKGDWQPIETAPKNGTVYIGRSLDPKRPFGPRRMRWGVAARPDEGYVGNDGKPWFINEDGRHLAPRPTHWTPATKGAAHD